MPPSSFQLLAVVDRKLEGTASCGSGTRRLSYRICALDLARAQGGAVYLLGIRSRVVKPKAGAIEHPHIPPCD